MTVWKKQNCEVFLARLPVKSGYFILRVFNSATVAEFADKSMITIEAR
jgi:hypothetical protein